MGGTLKKLAKNHEIHVLFLAAGVLGRRNTGSINSPKNDMSEEIVVDIEKETKIRQNHAKRALRVFGIKNLKFLDFPTVELDKVPLLQVIKSIEKEIEETKCHTIFTHHYNDINLDHRVAYEATITAARPVPWSKVYSILSFEIPAATDWRHPYSFNPNMYVDITSELRFKIKALKQYQHELREPPHPRSEEMIESVAKRWGALAGFHAAEPFEIIIMRLKNISELSILK